jgi:hypothetical protein
VKRSMSSSFGMHAIQVGVGMAAERLLRLVRILVS